MSRPLLIALDSIAPQAWRNGGGSTRELYAWPAGPLWRWRISVAEITQDGPFSAYHDVDRIFAVIDGAGVRLKMPDATEQELLMASAPLFFAGEAAPDCRLIDGPTRDLNLMSQRGAGRSTMQRAAVGQAWVSAAPLRALFTAEVLSLKIDGQAPLAMTASTLAISPHAAHERWQVLVPMRSPALQSSSSQSAAAPLQAWWLDFLPAAVEDRR